MFGFDGENRNYDYWDFVHALKKLPDEVSTAAYTEWMYAFMRGDKEKRQAIYNKYVGWSKTPEWKTKPWTLKPWQR